MAFPESVRQAAYERAGGRCECKRRSCTCHRRNDRCYKKLRRPHWHAHHRTAVSSGGSDTLGNCEILCVECHKNTGTYGVTW